MDSAGLEVSVSPPFAIPGGEIEIQSELPLIGGYEDIECTVGGEACRLSGASRRRLMAVIPDDLPAGTVEVAISVAGEEVAAGEIIVGRKLTGDLHQVANPAVDPSDGSIVLTRSGSRGQELPVTLFRLDQDGFLNELGVSVMNPTGVAFDQKGRLFVTNRADGEVIQINNDNEMVPLSDGLGVATGIAFDGEGRMYVGDRSGTIHRVNAFGDSESWTILEPSVSAYHIAFGKDGGLYVSAPGLCSYDVIYRIDENGDDKVFFKGLGRPQGIAFDDDGNLYVAACLKGRHGIVRISPDGENAELFVAGMGIVGLCFTRDGEMIVATAESVYSIDAGIQGILLD